jgi:hypothetical protein
MSARVGTEAQSRSVATAVHPGVLSQVPAEITENSLQPAAADSHAGRHGIVVLPRRQSFVAATVAFGAACTSTSFSCSWRVAAGPAAARAATPSTTIAASASCLAAGLLLLRKLRRPAILRSRWWLSRWWLTYRG